MLLPARVEDYVAADNPVRAVDAYVDSLELVKLGFKNAAGDLSAGQPAYHPGVLLKLYLYGYLMRIRTSRMLERETQRNLELIWLLEGLRPSYKTIAEFRKDNAQALKAANRDFVVLCKELDLYGAELVALDGSFFRGNVAKHSIYTKQRLRKLLKRIEQDIEAYLRQLDRADTASAEVGQPPGTLQDKLEALKQRRAGVQDKLEELEQSGQTQYAEVDPDARLLSKAGQSVAGYNVQIAVDAKHKLLVECALTQDGNDSGQLAPMAIRAKQALGVERLDVTADSGYYNHLHLQQCQQAGITPYVAIPERNGPLDAQRRLTREAFSFEPAHNRYRCPQGELLSYRRSLQQGHKRLLVYASSEPVCARCPLRGRCLSANTPCREIYRWEHQALVEAHARRMAERGRQMLGLRAALVEHPLGTLKRWCGWVHFMVRGKPKVSGEINLLMLCYNFKRVLSIVGIDGLRAHLAVRPIPG
jgi:transposase